MSAKLDTPMMRQYLAIKKKYPEEILFFRMGDFYEMFLEDAIFASKVLDIALTKRQDKIPMCGIPYHALHNYVHKILEAGKKIAICEQVENPEDVSGRIVKREVIRILTPGTIFEEDLLSEKTSRRFAAVYPLKNNFSSAVLDPSTGQIFIRSAPFSDIQAFFTANNVVEAVSFDERFTFSGSLSIRKPGLDSMKYVDSLLKKHLPVQNLDPLELQETEKKALALAFTYLEEIAPGAKIRWTLPKKIRDQNRLILDEAALTTLEILKDSEGKKAGSLLATIDFTVTGGGSRLLAEELAMPYYDKNEIEKRLDAISFFMENTRLQEDIRQKLHNWPDLERVIINLENKPQVRHLGQLRDGLNLASEIFPKLAEVNSLPEFLQQISKVVIPETLRKTLNEALREDLPPILDERPFLKKGYSEIFDELLDLAENAQEILRNFEAKEKEKTGLSGLKVKYNKVIGYFIELPKGQAKEAPENYARRQTLTNAERFTTEELKNLEEKLLSAKEQVFETQKAIFLSFVEDIRQEIQILKDLAEKIAKLDVILSHAYCAKKRNYTRPEITKNDEIILKDSRHPVVEALFSSEPFIPNDVWLNNRERHLAILTGPNMAGKSTYIRQIALIQILAQAGSFIPASEGRLCLVDRIFTRIGAYDRLAKGQSTFYVEMSECARIFAGFSPHSLILLDEVGRGTSTYDGISIARAMIEYLNQDEYGRPKTLFATHYAELAELIEPNKGIIGLTVQAVEDNDNVIFLRKIVEGKADKSYGIQVAKMAGMPDIIIERAKELLDELEKEGLWQHEPPMTRSRKQKKSLFPYEQLSIFDN
ncbi:MAG: DNA mismatch repair protein MutS [Candidatus Hydrogenedentota bacterium]|nr:MAG: DNA mismatch repair protein MutS [Candidatus Hydrogenedentota bacterium]